MSTSQDKYPAILLYSGGIDSLVAYHYLDKPQTVYFDMQTKYTQKELFSVLTTINSTIVDNSLNMRERETGENAYVPFRNLLLAAQAAHYSDLIFIAGVRDDKVSDKTPEAFNVFSQVLSGLEGRKISVRSPFWGLTKEEVVKWYLKNVDNTGKDLIKGVSCYADNTKNYCGECPSCFRKWCALYANGIQLKFTNSTLMASYYERASNERYLDSRNKSIIKCVDDYRSRH